MIDLTEMRELVEKATPGEWWVEPHTGVDKRFFVDPDIVMVDYDDVDHNQQDANAAFMAASRQYVPESIAEIERLRNQLEAAREVIEAVEKYETTPANNWINVRITLKNYQEVIK